MFQKYGLQNNNCNLISLKVILNIAFEEVVVPTLFVLNVSIFKGIVLLDVSCLVVANSATEVCSLFIVLPLVFLTGGSPVPTTKSLLYDQ